MPEQVRRPKPWKKQKKKKKKKKNKKKKKKMMMIQSVSTTLHPERITQHVSDKND
jgi:hypothetical protein